MPKLRQVVFVDSLLRCSRWRLRRAFPSPLDPTAHYGSGSGYGEPSLPEEYVWTAGDVTALRPDHGKFPWNRPELRVTPHRFRATFRIAELPPEATLYVAGPREAHVYLNGSRIDDFYLNTDAPIGFHVFHAPVAKALRMGENVLAIEAVRGRGIVCGDSSAATQQLTYGEVLAAKIVPARLGVEALALVVSNSAWRSATSSPDGSELTGRIRASTTQVAGCESVGSVEGTSTSSNGRRTPGCMDGRDIVGCRLGLRTFVLPPVTVTHVFAGRAALQTWPP